MDEPVRRGSFVGRVRERTIFDRFLAGEGGRGVLLVHGPGGIGKSALLESFAQHAATAGWSTHAWSAVDVIDHEVRFVDLGDLAASPGPRLLLIDGCDDVAALMRQLRARVAHRLAPENRLVVGCAYRHLSR